MFSWRGGGGVLAGEGWGGCLAGEGVGVFSWRGVVGGV